MSNENLPMLLSTNNNYDGFGAPDDRETGGRLGQGSFIKFGTDAVWRTAADNQAIPADFRAIAIATTRAVQHWRDKRPVPGDTIIEAPGVTLPDIEKLNSKIPQNTWEKGPNGEPKPPWQLERVLYLLNPTDASKYTFASSTKGAEIALSNLKERIRAMRNIRREEVYAIVQLSSAPFKTRFGMKVRPEFKIIEWCTFGGDAAPAIAGPQPIKPLTLGEELNDKIDF